MLTRIESTQDSECTAAKNPQLHKISWDFLLLAERNRRFLRFCISLDARIRMSTLSDEYLPNFHAAEAQRPR